MKTVLVCTQAVAPVGGVQRWLDQLAEGLPARGWRVVAGLAWGRFHDPAAFEAAHPRLETLRLDGRSGTRAGRLLALHDAVRRVRPAVVVPASLADPYDLVAERRASGEDLRLLVGAFEISAPLLLEARRYAGLVDRALGSSRLAAHLLDEVARVPRARVDYVPPGFATPPAPAPRSRGSRLRLGLVGRLDPDKRPLDLLALLAALEQRGLDCEAHVVGDGPLRPALAAGGARPLADGRLFLRGALPAATIEREVWPALDIALLFSPAEGGLPNVVAEAMAHGVAVVASDFHGRAWQALVRDDETALVFPVGDAQAAAECVARLAGDPARRARLTAAARAELARDYTLEAMLAGWQRSLDAATAGPPARATVAARPAREVDRLSTWLGRRLGERARRLLRRGHRHADASEWPHFYPHDDADARAAEASIEAAVRTGA